MLRRLSQNVIPTCHQALNSYVYSSYLLRSSGSIRTLSITQIRHENSASAAALKPAEEATTSSTENAATSVNPENLDGPSTSSKSEIKQSIVPKTGPHSTHKKDMRNDPKTSTSGSTFATLQDSLAASLASDENITESLPDSVADGASSDMIVETTTTKKSKTKAKARAKAKAKAKAQKTGTESVTKSEETVVDLSEGDDPVKEPRKDKGKANISRKNAAIDAGKKPSAKSKPETPLLEFVRHHGSDAAALKFERYLDNQSKQQKQARTDQSARRRLISLLQSDKLSLKSREVAMRHLRESLIQTSVDFKPKVSASETLAGKLKAFTSIGAAIKGGSDSLPRRGSREPLKKEPPLDLSSNEIFSVRGLRPKEPIDIKSVDSADLDLVPVIKEQPAVPKLSYGLERVLFNPGVYQLRDPRSRVFNFDPYLQSIMPVSEFDFNALKEYITSSRDDTLLSTAKAENRKYTGSTSSMTSALAHFHFLLSSWRPIDVGSLSKGFPADLRTFTALQRSPSAIFLRWKDGTYAIDADKQFDTANILSMLGKSMEKLLTLNTEEFERYRKVNSDQISEEERNEDEAYHYTTMGDFLMRSQLDAYDPRIPGTGMFDLKTRAVVSIRMDTQNYKEGMGYEIRGRHGEFESYEREYFDMIRSAFLKYSLQVRMGRMDGIFVAFHNTERIFGFQYISLPEMDSTLHGTDDLTIGDQEFKLSLDLLNRVLDRATKRYPDQSIRLHFETRASKTPFMYIFAEPVTEEEIKNIQEANKAKIVEFEKKVLGLHVNETPEESAEKERQAAEELNKQRRDTEWQELQANVKETMEIDGFDMNNQNGDDDSNDTDTFLESSRHAGRSEDKSAGTAYLDDATDEMQEDEEEDDGEEDDAEAEDSGEDEENEESEKTDEENDENESDEDMDYRDGEEGLEEQDEDVEDKQSTSDQLQSNSTSEGGDNREMSFGPDGFENSTEKESQKEILCMTLTIRNKVNGKFVTRPDKLTSSDNWTVEYSLAEVEDAEKSKSLYAATQKRRKQALDKDDDDGRIITPYLRQLRELSSKGKEWRLEQDRIDEAEPLKVLHTAPMSYVVDDAPSEG